MPTLRCRLLLLGDSTVGKTSVITQLISQSCPKNYQMTIGFETKAKAVAIPDTYYKVEFEFIDTSGHPLYKDLTLEIMAGSNMVIFMLDVTNEASLQNLKYWIETVNQHNPERQIPGIIIGNKVDLEERRMVAPDIAQSFAGSYGYQYYEISAMKNIEVETPFNALAQTYYSSYQNKIEMVKNHVEQM